MQDTDAPRPLAGQIDDAGTSPCESAAVLTPPGRGAVATIRVTGNPGLLDRPPALFRAKNGRPLADQSLNRIVFGQWGDDHPEDMVACRREHDAIDLHCHGGAAAAARILDSLGSRGCTISDWFEQTAARNGLLHAECLDALSRAPTRRTAEILLDQYSGTLRAAFENLRNTRDPAGRVQQARDLLKWSRFGGHLTVPWKVVLTGRPNVGKSSLVNALVGYARSIVYSEPGTTRDVVTTIAAFDGWPMEVADTAGIRDAAGPIEAAGIELARTHLAAADCRVIVLDISRPRDCEDLRLLSEFPDALIVAHKSDLPSAWNDEIPPQAIAASSVTRDGVDRLVTAIVARLIPEVPPFGTAIPVTPRQLRILGQLAETARTEQRETNHALAEDLLR